MMHQRRDGRSNDSRRRHLRWQQIDRATTQPSSSAAIAEPYLLSIRAMFVEYESSRIDRDEGERGDRNANDIYSDEGTELKFIEPTT